MLLLLPALLYGCVDPERAGLFDLDGDGEGAIEAGCDSCTDCDDLDETVNTAGVEVCDGVDNDCDGTTDIDATDATTWYADGDNDGHGSLSAPTDACEVPPGHVASSDDCNDGAPTTFPGADEVCNDADDDCDGEVDEEPVEGGQELYADQDGDGYGAGPAVLFCEHPGPPWDDPSGDCDDGDAAIGPHADETCGDGVDNNCDGAVDEGC